MFELTIDNNVYQFTFGMGFVREVNKMYQKPIDGIPGKNENVGLQMMVAGLYSRDAEYLVTVLEAANKTHNPRVTRMMLDNYIDEPNTDIDALFDEVMDFLRTANATKNVVCQLIEAMEEQKKKAAAN